MSDLPIIVRNRSALFARGFMMIWLGGVAVATCAALRDGSPEPDRWWPLIMLTFWAVGLGALVWSMNEETSELRIDRDRSILILRGPAFRRREYRTDRARFWIEDTSDSDGDPYFKLTMDAPGGKLAIREGHGRADLERLQARIEAAVRR